MCGFISEKKIESLELGFEFRIAKQRGIKLPKRFLMLSVGSGLAWPEVQHHLDLAVISVSWLVLGGEQTVDKVWGQVDTVKSGLGNEGAPVEGVLSIIGVEMTKTVR